MMNEWQTLVFMIDTFVQTKNEARVSLNKLKMSIFKLSILFIGVIAIASCCMLNINYLLKFSFISLSELALIFLIVRNAVVTRDLLNSVKHHKKVLKDFFVRIHEYHTYSKKTHWSEFEKVIMIQKLQLADPNI